MNEKQELRSQPDLVVVGSEKEKRIAEIERLGWNLHHFLKSRTPGRQEETINLLYNTFCELDEQFTGGYCTIENWEDSIKKDIANFLKVLPDKFGGQKKYRAELQVKLCMGAMSVELMEADNGHGPISGFGTVDASPMISEVFVGNEIFKPKVNR